MKAAPFSWTVLALAALLVSPTVQAQRVIYVDTDATGTNDGFSWSNAFVFLQDALSVAQDGDEVWVAEGVYRPDQGAGIQLGDREVQLVLAQGVTLRGGFAGTESSPAERRLEEHESVLTGDLLGNDPVGIPPVIGALEYADNSRGLLYINITNWINGPLTTLEGLTLRGSSGDRPTFSGADCVLSNLKVVENSVDRSDAPVVVRDCEIDNVLFARNRGSRDGSALIVYASINGRRTVIRGSRFADNRGAYRGGALLVNGSATVLVSESVFESNSAWDGGAILARSLSELTIVSSRFLSNQATCAGGGIAGSGDGHITVVNSLFASNVALGACNEIRGGGAGLVYKATLEAYNSTFVGNRSPTGGDVLAADDGVVRLVNSIVFGNDSGMGTGDFQSENAVMELTHVLHDEVLPSGVTATGPLIHEPARFVDPEGPDRIRGTMDDDYRQLPDSPGIDAGDAALLLPDHADLDRDGDRLEATPLDLDRNPRVAGPGGPMLDLGALEVVGSTRTQAGDAGDPGRSGCGIEAYPNPFRSRLTVAVHARTPSSLEVFDSIGRQVMSRLWANPGGSTTITTLNTESWKPGTYFLTVSTPAGLCRASAIRVR